MLLTALQHKGITSKDIDLFVTQSLGKPVFYFYFLLLLIIISVELIQFSLCLFPVTSFPKVSQTPGLHAFYFDCALDRGLPQINNQSFIMSLHLYA